MPQFIITGIIFFGLSSLGYAVKKQPIIQPWLRLQGSAEQIKISPKLPRYVAFTESRGKRLQVVDTRDQTVKLITKHKVGMAFFWAPDGLRLFYRQLVKTKKGHIESQVMAFDCITGTNVEVAKYPDATGVLTYDPRDLRMQIMSKGGLHSHKIYFPDQRLARWQASQRTDNGKWVIGQKGVLWATEGGYAISQIKDDGSGIQSFDISPDGTSIAWATNNEAIYISKSGNPAKKLAAGVDPKWHPVKPLIVFSSARKLGDKIIDYDLRITDPKGSSAFVTVSPESKERWPAWDATGEHIFFTKSNTTDVFRMKFADESTP